MMVATVLSATPGRMRWSSVRVSLPSLSVVGVTSEVIFCLLRTKNRGRFTRSGHDFSRFSHHSGDMATTRFPAAAPKRPLALGRTIRDGARRLAELAATPLVPADYLDVFNPLRRGAELRGRVVAVTPETEDAA